MTTRRFLPIAAAAAVVILTACGDGETVDAGGPALADLEGRSFWSTSVTEDGAERPLVDGTQIALSFDADSLSASAGCNALGGTYRLDDGILVVGDLAMTEMGCDPERHAQDDFVAGLLTARPRMAIDGDRLTLTTDSVVADFLDREVADPDRPITGTEWEVTGFIDGDVATSFAVDEPATLVFADRSTLTGFDGCAGFSISVEVSDGSIGGPVEGDGEIQFGSMVQAEADCDLDPTYTASLYRALTGGASYTIDGPNLTILNRNGTGITLRATGEE